MRRSILAAAIWLTALPVFAQDVWGWSIIIPSVTGTDQLGTYFHNQQQAGAGGAQRPASPPPASAGSAPSAGALRFTPSAERRKANFSGFLAERRGGDAAALRQLEALLNDPALMPKLEAELGKLGLRPDNMADAYAVWWISAWQAAQGKSSDPSPASARAVKAQAERIFLAVPALANSDDATKQAFSEGLLVQAVLLSAATEQAEKDPTQLRAIGQIARQGARRFGLDLDTLTLTDAGFVGGPLG